MTPEALSRITSIPLEILLHGISKLSEPDPQSRSEKFGGRRIIQIDPDRSWGWIIVNKKKYRDIASHEEKKEIDRLRIAKKREESKMSQGVADCSKVSQNVADVAYTDTDTNTEELKERRREKKESSGESGQKSSSPRHLNDEEWILKLQQNPAYKGIDIECLRGKMIAWCEEHGKKPTRRRLLNWLNREDKPVNAGKPKSTFLERIKAQEGKT